MRLVRRLLGFGLLAASVLIVRGRRRAARAVDATLGASDVDFDDSMSPAGTPSVENVDLDNSVGTSMPANENENLVDVATKSGIADVDPVPLSHVAGEGIDLEGDVKAHSELRDLRDRLPR